MNLDRFTCELYKRCMLEFLITRLHLKPALGRVKLKALAPAHVRGLYREKLEAGSSARAPYATSTPRSTRPYSRR